MPCPCHAAMEGKVKSENATKLPKLQVFQWLCTIPKVLVELKAGAEKCSSEEEGKVAQDLPQVAGREEDQRRWIRGEA